jgi:hypothetical protein
MTRLDDGRGNIARLQWIKSKVLSMRVKSQSDIGLMDNLESVVRQNLKGPITWRATNGYLKTKLSTLK